MDTINMKPEITLTKALLISVLPQHQQYYRPYQSHIDAQNLERVYQLTNEGKQINKHRLASVAGSIIAPTYTPIAEVYIPNGFQQMRFSFILEITVKSIYGVEKEIIRGFTDTMEMSYSGIIDPELKFFINSRTSLCGVLKQNNQYDVKSIKGDYNVLSGIIGNDAAVSLRPEDAVAYNQVGDMRNMGHEIIDDRIMLGSRAKMSNVNHNLPSSYLADICNGYIKGYRPIAEEHEYSTLDDYDQVISFVVNETTATSYFYNAMRLGYEPDNLGYIKDYFTFREINQTFPVSSNFWHVIKPDFTKQLTTPLECSQHWGGINSETNIAFQLTHMLPGIMSDYCLKKIRLTATNMTVGNHINISVMGYVTLVEGIMNEFLIQNLCGRIELDVIKGLFLQKASTFFVLMEVDLLGISYFEISINDGIKVPFTAPMFCSNFYSPMIGLDEEPLAQIADSVDIIARELLNNNITNMFNDRPFIAKQNNPIIPTPSTQKTITNIPKNNVFADTNQTPSVTTTPVNKYNF